MPILKSYITRTMLCPECERKFSGRDLRTLEKLISLHCKTSHQTNIKTDYKITETSILHYKKYSSNHKLTTDAEMKALIEYIKMDDQIKK